MFDLIHLVKVQFWIHLELEQIGVKFEKTELTSDKVQYQKVGLSDDNKALSSYVKHI